MRRLALSLLAAGFLVACNRTPTAPTGVPLSASRGEHGSAPVLVWSQGTNSDLTSYDFGTVDPASPSSVTFTLTNTGGRSSGTITSVSLSTSTAYSITADGCTDNALGPNDSCTVTVEFTSTEGSTSTATLTADAEHASASLDLTGKGPGVADLSLSPGTSLLTIDGTNWYAYYFYGTGLSQTFTVTNAGTATTGHLGVVEAVSDFVVSSDQCSGGTLAPNASCTFTITAASCPSSSSGTLTVNDVNLGKAYIELEENIIQCPG
jgi:hypothetical protein